MEHRGGTITCAKMLQTFFVVPTEFILGKVGMPGIYKGIQEISLHLSRERWMAIPEFYSARCVAHWMDVMKALWIWAFTKDSILRTSIRWITSQELPLYRRRISYGTSRFGLRYQGYERFRCRKGDSCCKFPFGSPIELNVWRRYCRSYKPLGRERIQGGYRLSFVHTLQKFFIRLRFRNLIQQEFHAVDRW